MTDLARHWLELLYLMAPAYLANMAPPFVRYWKGWNRPIHEPTLGSHKTVLGFALGIVTAIAVTGIQAAIGGPLVRIGYEAWPLLGLCFGVGAMTGDCVKSYLKRKRGVAPGGRWVPWDQLDFVLGALLFVSPFARLTWGDVAVILVVSFVGDLAVNRVAYRLGIKDSPW